MTSIRDRLCKGNIVSRLFAALIGSILVLGACSSTSDAVSTTGAPSPADSSTTAPAPPSGSDSQTTTTTSAPVETTTTEATTTTTTETSAPANSPAVEAYWCETFEEVDALWKWTPDEFVAAFIEALETGATNAPVGTLEEAAAQLALVECGDGYGQEIAEAMNR